MVDESSEFFSKIEKEEQPLHVAVTGKPLSVPDRFIRGAGGRKSIEIPLDSVPVEPPAPLTLARPMPPSQDEMPAEALIAAPYPYSLLGSWSVGGVGYGSVGWGGRGACVSIAYIQQ